MNIRIYLALSNRIFVDSNADFFPGVVDFVDPSFLPPDRRFCVIGGRFVFFLLSSLLPRVSDIIGGALDDDDT